MSFSRKYKTFEEWLSRFKGTSAYKTRIIHAHKNYPRASLSQLRGHPGKKRKKLTNLISRHKPKKREHIYRDIRKIIMQYERPMFKIYVLGRYKEGVIDTEKYQPENEPIPAFFYLGIKSKSDYQEFISKKSMMKSYRFYDITGKRVLNSELMNYFA